MARSKYRKTAVLSSEPLSPRASNACWLAMVVLSFWWGLSGLSAQASPGSVFEPSTSPRPLATALEELREQGLEVVYSTALVAADLETTRRVEDDTLPERQLELLLAPHGLAAVRGAGGAWLVVRGDQEQRAAALEGRILERHTGAPVAHATVELVGGQSTTTGSNGAFELTNLEGGSHELVVRHAGYEPLLEQRVRLPAGDTVLLEISLRPIPLHLDEIVVRASEIRLLEERPAAPLSMSKRDVRALPHLASDPLRALTLLPGTAANDNTARLSLRGGRRDELAIRLDGQELYQAFHLADYDDALSLVTSRSLSDVALSAGTLSARFGDRMGGLLDLRTRSPSARSHELNANLLTVEAASATTFDPGDTRLLATARRGSFELARRVFGEEDPSFWDSLVKLMTSPNDRVALSGHLLLGGDSLSIRERVDDEEFKDFDTSYRSRYLWLRADHFANASTHFEHRLSWSDFDRRRLGIEDEEEGLFEIDDDRAYEVLEVASRLNYAPGQTIQWDSGIEVRRYRTRLEYRNSAAPPFLLATDLLEPRVQLVEFSGQPEGDHVAASLSSLWSASDRLTLQLGLRLDRHDLTDEDLLSPRLSLAYRIGDRSVLRAGWGHFHQSQRAHELAVEDGETHYARAERTEQFLVGLEHHFRSESPSGIEALRIEAYRRTIDRPRPRFLNLFEPLNTFPEVEPDRVRIAPERARSEGIELALRGRLGSKTRWRLALTAAEATDTIGGSEVPRRRDQRLTSRAIFSRDLPRGLRLDLAWRHHTGWPTTPVELVALDDDPGERDFALQPGRLHSERLPANHRLDLRLSKQFVLRRGSLELYLDVQNLYDRNNLAGFDLAVDEDLLELERSAEYWVGIFPSAGVTWRF